MLINSFHYRLKRFKIKSHVRSLKSAKSTDLALLDSLTVTNTVTRELAGICDVAWGTEGFEHLTSVWCNTRVSRSY